MSYDLNDTGACATIRSTDRETRDGVPQREPGEHVGSDNSLLFLDAAGTVVAATDDGSVDYLFDRRSIAVGDHYASRLRGAAQSKQAAFQFADAVELVLRGELPSYTVPTDSVVGERAAYELSVRRLAALGPVQAVVERRVVSSEKPGRSTADRELLALVAELTDNAVIITDADGRIEWVNAGFTRITEYGLEEVVGKTPGSFLQGPATDLDTVRRMREALERREGFNVQILNYAKSGRPYWLDIEVRPVRNAAGEVVRFIAIEADITAMREKEMQLNAASQQARELAHDLERSKRLLDLALRGAGLGIWHWNPLTGEGGRSDYWLALTGYGADEVESNYSGFESLLHPLDFGPTVARLGECVEGIRPYDSTFRLRVKGGGYRWFHARGDVLERTAEGRAKMVAGTLEDVHERTLEAHRREAERALLSSILASLPAAVWWKDTELRFLGCNDAFAADAGFDSPADVIGKEDADMPWSPEEALAYRADDRRVLDSGIPLIDIEETQQCVGGISRTVITNKSPLRDAAGRVCGVLGVLHDVSALKRAESAARDAEERVRSVFRSAGDAILVVHGSGSIVEANASAERLFGSEGEGLIGTNVSKYLPGAFDDVLETPHSDDATTAGDRRTVEAVGDGDRRFTAELSTTTFESDGHQYYTCILHDVTERRRVQSRASAFARIIDQSPAEVYLIDAATLRFVDVNRGACQNLGYAKDELLERCPVDVKTDCDETQLRARLMTLENSEDRRLEYDTHFRRKDGSVYPVHVCLSRDALEDREVYLALVTDLSKREELERQLAQAQKLESLGEMAAGIAHEINTPMQYVSGNVEFLKNCYERLFEVVDKYGESFKSPTEDWHARSEEMRQLIERTRFGHIRLEVPAAIEEAAVGVQRVIDIVRAMKTFCHPGMKEKVPTDLNGLLESTAILTRNRWKYQAVLELDVATDLPEVMALPAELSQVVLNLIVNAADAILERVGESPTELGKIVLRTAVEDGNAILEVSDDGCGIRKEHLGRIFEPFFTTKDVGKGTGQGLALSYDVVVNKLGGRIDVKSEVGVGSCFTVRLPLYPASSEPPSNAGTSYAPDALSMNTNAALAAF